MTGPVRLGIAPMTPDDIEVFGAECEAMGADLLTVGEGPTEFRDPFVNLSRLAEATERVMLTIAVSTPRLRHAAVLANAFATLDEISGGRAAIGLGSGDLGLVELGEKPVRLAELEEYATTVKTLACGGEVQMGDRDVRIRWAGSDIPLWLAADGPKMLHLAGRIADGVIVGQAGDPAIVRTVRERVAEGARSAGRSPDDIDIWYMVRAIATDVDDGAIRLDGYDEYGSRQVYFLWRVCGRPDADSMIEAIEARKGIRLDEDTAQRLARYIEGYSVADAWGTKRNVELLEEVGLTDWAGRLFYASGPPSTVQSRIAELVDAGATNFIIPAKNEPTLEERLAHVRPIADVFEALNADLAG